MTDRVMRVSMRPLLWMLLFVAVSWLDATAASVEKRQQTMGDVNADGVTDVSDLNRIVSHILHIDTLAGGEFLCADLTADSVIDIGDVNALVNVIVEKASVAPEKGWMVVEPEVMKGQMISMDGKLTDYGHGRLLVWNVTAGDTLRLSIDHDNRISVNMRSFTIYDTADASQWTPAHALAQGCGIREVEQLKVYDPIVVPDGAAVMVCSGYWYENGRIGDQGTAASNPYTAYRLERWVDASLLPVRRALNVLTVGNSFTCDEVSYVPYVIQSIAPDVDLHLRILMIPNGTVEDWVAAMDTVTTSRFYDWQPFPGRWTTPEPCALREQVQSEDWDVVTFQQGSHLPFWSEVQPPLSHLTSWLRDSVHFEGRIGWVLNHAYSDSNVVDSPLYPKVTTSDEMWETNKQLAFTVLESGLVDFVLPSGTAVQNARHTRLRQFTRNQLCDGYWDWTHGKTGGRHLQEGIGPFVAACAAAGALLGQSPVDAQVNLSATWRIPAANPVYVGSPQTNPTLDQIDRQKGGLGMDPDSQALGAWCAEQAMQRPFELIDDLVEDGVAAENSRP